MNTVLRTLLLSASLLGVAACAGSGGAKPGPDAVVADRAQKRWDALVQRDFATAYDYLSAGGKSLQSREGYAVGMSVRPVRWTDAEVKSVVCPEGESWCEVNVRVGFEVKMNARGVGKVTTHSAVIERWVKSGDSWGYVPPEVLKR